MKSCRKCQYSIHKGKGELHCTLTESAATIGNRWLNQGKICETYGSPRLDREMDEHCHLLAEHCMKYDPEAWHIQINGVAYCQASITLDIDEKLYHQQKLARETDRPFRRVCEHYDKGEAIRFANRLAAYFVNVQVVDGKCQQRDDEFVIHDEL